MSKVLKLGFTLGLLATSSVAWAEPMQFETPDAAVAAVIAALEIPDRAAVLKVFGPENEDILSSENPGQDEQDWGKFLRDAETYSRIDLTSEDAARRRVWRYPPR